VVAEDCQHSHEFPDGLVSSFHWLTCHYQQPISEKKQQPKQDKFIIDDIP